MVKKKIIILISVTTIAIFIRYFYYLNLNIDNLSNGYAIDYNLGLGKVVFSEVSNDRNYEWYIDQFETGKYNYENCGPSAAAMAVKWSSNGERGDASLARSSYKSRGGWWSILDIESYLEDEDIKYKEEYFINKSKIIRELNKGNILVLCIDPRFININEKGEEKSGLFYPPSSGHFILIKGYKLVDKNIFFECYDPASFNERYKSGELKGKDRYYLGDEVIFSSSIHWNGMLIIQ